jgi:hypothetical protein
MAAAQQTLTVVQMYALARKAGLSQLNAVTAAAVGMAESSGRAWITSKNPDGGTNVGVWQEDTKGAGSGYTVAQLQDPATNAKVMAKGSSNGTNWSQWSAYTSGAYTLYMAQASAAQLSETKAIGQATGGSSWEDDILKAAGVVWNDTGGKVVSAAGNLLQLPSQVTDFLQSLEQPVQAAMWLVNPTNWARILAGVFGFLLLTAGLITLGMSA